MNNITIHILYPYGLIGSSKSIGKLSKFFLFIFIAKINDYGLTQSIKRPIGVTIIAILTIIDGVLLVIGGLSLLVLGAFFAAVPMGTIISEQQQQQLQPQIQNEAELQALSQFHGNGL
jgi:hypothetical protein